MILFVDAAFWIPSRKLPNLICNAGVRIKPRALARNEYLHKQNPARGTGDTAGKYTHLPLFSIA